MGRIRPITQGLEVKARNPEDGLPLRLELPSTVGLAFDAIPKSNWVKTRTNCRWNFRSLRAQVKDNPKAEVIQEETMRIGTPQAGWVLKCKKSIDAVEAKPENFSLIRTFQGMWSISPNQVGLRELAHSLRTIAQSRAFRWQMAKKAFTLPDMASRNLNMPYWMNRAEVWKQSKKPFKSPLIDQMIPFLGSREEEVGILQPLKRCLSSLDLGRDLPEGLRTTSKKGKWERNYFKT